MQQLDLNDCRYIFEEGISHVLRTCSNITHFNLNNCSRMKLYCYNVTTKGVKHVVENCTQLREINMSCRYKVATSSIISAVPSRPSLREITGTCRYHFSDRERELLSRHKCLVH
ncbi:F-box/LRR protein, putative [Medicago truncatula]|uniref:F-box/LRR protein, putative n=1 Tax=Medicago truncatula TaxID=3880 RepID=G7LBI8_MEDTR|nr:F-box/LRR protein, putative [Medicago truncatula]